MFTLINKINKNPLWIFVGGTLGILSWFGLTGEKVMGSMAYFGWLIYSIKWTLIWGAFIFSVYAYYKPKNLNVFKNIADATRNLNSVNFCFKDHNNINIPIDITWESWINDIKRAEGFNNNDLLDYYNFGKYFYFFDLDTGKEIKIPINEKSRTEKVGNSLKKGMVLRLMPRDV